MATLPQVELYIKLCEELGQQADTEEFENKYFSETAKNAMKYLIVNHCSLHLISYKERKLIEEKIKIQRKQLFKANCVEVENDKRNQ